MWVLESQRGQWLHLLLFFGERTQASGKEDPMNPGSTRKHVHTITQRHCIAAAVLSTSLVSCAGGDNCFSGLCGGAARRTLEFNTDHLFHVIMRGPLLEVSSVDWDP